ncbi:hypothetical protein FB446DRAFT_791507 [Lentinula raphanica]|nr:hypothetical protein FB446DRAFT_791507 [Lentinula raphanica]
MHPRALHVEPNGWTVNIQFKGSPKYGRRNEDTANVILILQNMAQALQPYLPPGTLFYLPSQGHIPFWNAKSQIEFDYYVYKELPPTSVPKSEDHKAGSGSIMKNGQGNFETTIVAERSAVSVMQNNAWKDLPPHSLTISNPKPLYLYDFQLEPRFVEDYGPRFKTTLTLVFETPTALVYTDKALDMYARIITKMKNKGLEEETLVYFPAQGLVPSWDNNEIKFNLYFHDGAPRPLTDPKGDECGSGVVKKNSYLDIVTTFSDICLPKNLSKGKGREEEHNVTPTVISDPMSQDMAESSQPKSKGKKKVRFLNDPSKFPSPPPLAGAWQQHGQSSQTQELDFTSDVKLPPIGSERKKKKESST